MSDNTIFTSMDRVEEFAQSFKDLSRIDNGYMVYQDQNSFVCESEFSILDDLGLATAYIPFLIAFPCEGDIRDFTLKVEFDNTIEYDGDFRTIENYLENLIKFTVALVTENSLP